MSARFAAAVATGHPASLAAQCIAALPPVDGATLGILYTTEPAAAALPEITRALSAHTGIRSWVGGVDAAQRIIGAELQDDEIGLVGERPIEPRQAACRGVSRDPAIDDTHLDPSPAQRSFEPDREGLLGRQPVARAQTVAKIKNNGNVRLRRHPADHQAEPGRGQRSGRHRVENPGGRAISSEPPFAGRHDQAAGLLRRPA